MIIYRIPILIVAREGTARLEHSRERNHCVCGIYVYLISHQSWCVGHQFL